MSMNYRKLRNSDPTLLNYAVSLRKGASVAEVLAPVLTVDEPGGYYNIYTGNEDRTYDIADVRAPGSPTPEVFWSKSAAQFNCIERGAKYLVTDEEAGVTGDAAARQAATRLVRGKLDLGYEKRIAALAQDTANFGTVVAAGAFWSIAGTDIVAAIRAGKRGIRLKSGLEPTHILIPDNVVTGVLNNTALADLWTAEQKASGDLPGRFSNMTVITPTMVQQGANIAQTANLSYVWDGTTVAMFHINPNPSILEPTWALTFRDRSFGSQGIALESWRDNFRKGDYVEWRRKQDERVTMTGAAAIITGVA